MSDDGHGKKDGPNLEELAERLFTLSKKHEQIEPRITEAYTNIAKYTDPAGTVQYKTDFSAEGDKGKIKALADAVFDALSYHVHHLQFPAGKAYEDLKGIKDDHGTSYADNLVRKEFGVTRNQLQKIFDANKSNLSRDNILSLLQRNINAYTQTQDELIFDTLDDSHVPKVREYVSHIAKHHQMPRLAEGIDKIYSLDQLKQYFRTAAMQHYRNRPSQGGGGEGH